MVFVEVAMNTLPYKVVTKFIWWHQWHHGNGIDEMRQWLENNIGAPYKDWVSDVESESEFMVIKFRTERDAILFALKYI